MLEHQRLAPLGATRRVHFAEEPSTASIADIDALSEFGHSAAANPCPYRKSNPDVLMVQSAEERLGNDAADFLDCPRNWRILVQ
jgi:hypothetical protein